MGSGSSGSPDESKTCTYRSELNVDRFVGLLAFCYASQSLITFGIAGLQEFIEKPSASEIRASRTPWYVTIAYTLTASVLRPRKQHASDPVSCNHETR